MNEVNQSKKWWSKSVARLPIWVWIIIFISIVGAFGTSGNNENESSQDANTSETSDQRKIDTTVQEVEKTSPPSKPKLTTSQENASKAALSYLNSMAFSRQGLIDQLSSEYGSQFPLADAEFAVAYIEKDPGVNWNSQAEKSAKEYLASQSFSCRGLIDQLSSEYGSKFTEAQATYGATQAGLC